MQFRGSACGPPARPEASPARFEEVVNAFQLTGEELVVVAKLEQLRVGVLEKLNRGFGAGGSVVEERAVPTDHGEVIRIVRDSALQHFLSFALRERRGLATNDLRDLASVLG